MDQGLKKLLDNAFNDIAPELYLMSVVFGGIFIIIGLIMLFTKTELNYVKPVGYVCLGLGLLVIISNYFGI